MRRYSFPSSRSSRVFATVSLIGVGFFLAGCTDGPSAPDRQLGPSALVLDPVLVLTNVPLVPLATVPAPQPSGGDIKNFANAVILGKAFFWDAQASSDGVIACASCHWNAGADDRPGSVGVVPARFVSISPDPNHAADSCVVTGTVRQVTGRNAPVNIAAIFFRDNFWDGRANHTFNGFDPFGQTANQTGAVGTPIANASLASQSVGPPPNAVEMSCAGRPFNGSNSIAAKLLARTPLGKQLVAPDDGVLGALSNFPNPGLNRGYRQLIADAFGSDVANNAESLFSRIWGEAIQAYESTLSPDQTPLDRFLAGDQTALTDRQKSGLGLFQSGKGSCTKCHAGGELSDATFTFFDKNGAINEDGGDQGFHNNGVTATAADLGRAGTGPNGASFSVSGSVFDRGAFKTSGLRNVGLTAPYFHNGGKATLHDVVDFYARGGDFANPEKAKRITGFTISADETDALVDFLANGLTDCRVKRDAAPFDHPQLRIVDEQGNTRRVVGPFGRNGDPTATCP